MHAYRVIDTPIGALTLAASESGLASVAFGRMLPVSGPRSGAGSADTWLAEAETDPFSKYDQRPVRPSHLTGVASE